VERNVSVPGMLIRLITLVTLSEIYDSPVTAGTLSHIQLELSEMPNVNQLNSLAGQTTTTSFLHFSFPLLISRSCF